MSNETKSRAGAIAGGVIAAACAIAGPAQAQTTLRYAETARLQAPAGFLSYEALAINDAGEVGGYALKSAGKTWRLEYQDEVIDGYFPLARLFRLPKWVSTENFEAHPVVWKAGVPQVLKRYGGTYSSWILDTAGPSGWLAATATVAGKTKESESKPDFLARPLGSQPRTLTAAGVYSDVVPFVRFSFDPVMINDQGTVLVDASPAPLITVAGQTTPIPLPEDLVLRRLAGLGNGDMALIEGYKSPYQYLKRCFVWRAGVVKEITVPAPEPVVSVNCGAMNKDGLVVGAVYAWGPNGPYPYTMRRALFSWKDDQVLFLTPFTTGNAETFSPAGVTRAGVALSNDGPEGTVVYPGGTVAALGPLLNLGLRADEHPQLLRVNDAGQILLKIQVDRDARPVSYRVLSPR